MHDYLFIIFIQVLPPDATEVFESLWKLLFYKNYPSRHYLLKVKNRNTRTSCEKKCSKLKRKTPEWRQWRRSGVFIVNFEHISHLVLVFLLLILNMQLPTETFTIIWEEHENQE